MKKLLFLVGIFGLFLWGGGTFASYSFTDDFDREDGFLGNEWMVGTAAATISGHKMHIIAQSSYYNAMVKYPTSHINQTITFDFQNGINSQRMMGGLRQGTDPGESQIAYYFNIDFGSGAVFLRKVITGQVSDAGVDVVSSGSFIYTEGHTYQATVSANGTYPTVLSLDLKDLDTDINLISLSVEDSTPVLQNAGGVALWSYMTAQTGSIYVDNFSYFSNDGDIGENIETYTIQTSDLWNNGYNNSNDIPRQSPFSRFIFTTTAPEVILSTTAFGSPSSNYSKIAVRVNDEEKSTLGVPQQGTNTFTINLGRTGENKKVEFISSPHAATSATTLPSTMVYLDSVLYDSGYTFEVLSPVIHNERIVIYGDSISQGSRATNIMTEGYIPLLRNVYLFEDIMSEGRGFRSFYDDAATENQRNQFVQRLASYSPKTLYLAIGTNDNSILSIWGGINNFQVAYEDFLEKIHATLPNIRIIVQPLLAGLNNNSVSQTIKNVATGKDYVTLIDTVNRLNSGNPDFADGSTHPTTSGYIKYANRLSPLLSSSGFVVDGPQSGEILKETENYTLTLARGATFAGDQTITISVRTGTISATASTVINNASSNVQITPANGTTGFTFTYTTLDTSGTIEITFSNDQGWINPTPITLTVIDPTETVPTPPKSSGGGGGGGGSSITTKDNCPNGDYSPSYYDDSCGDSSLRVVSGETDEAIQGNEKSDNGSGLPRPSDSQGQNTEILTAYQGQNTEILTAYQRAFTHNITTLAPITDANPDGTVIRGHLAKMIVNYAINVLGRTLPEKVPATCYRKDGSNAWESQEIKEYAIKACQLGLMGIDMNYFQPNMVVTRAQFGTILSRLLWQNTYAGSSPYYARHLQALKEQGILTQIDNPEQRLELRQRVRLMLMRSAE